ncbi:bifunctional DNA-formamidopyrimidine glycosylase/DNA-(apurinic or apyrimidinic site) lyase [Haloglycomyces albus]|uniref:bifunctional DNA-formamidopyrimidine glycosylase/DNA-(apurinic or apyrimidinic site) lyase n=1 Tax=Haloglycomyces albus TaxID=526067 RepID=UPI0004A32776|nr:bifunctional DNA-formamidopyrimidine glycosylase/DNA-(apurinic or apyrimidinic site) lyase [Haloglycomyces albus]
MPELPEVETVRQGVARAFVGAEFAQVTVHHPRAVRKQAEGADYFSEVLKGASITGTGRRGKYLWLHLDNDQALICHLGMSGQLHVVTRPRSPHRHLRIRMSFRDERQLWFVDQRTFGGMELSETSDGLPDRVSHIAPDVFDPAYSASQAIERLRAKNSDVKRVLLDQSWVSGIGNIYADEALWRSGVSPTRQGRDINSTKAKELLRHTTDVLSEAIAVGGTSFDELYVNVNGESGYFERSLSAYGREGLPCKRCDTRMRKKVIGGRASHYCPGCQR